MFAGWMFMWRQTELIVRHNALLCDRNILFIREFSAIAGQKTRRFLSEHNYYNRKKYLYNSDNNLQTEHC